MKQSRIFSVAAVAVALICAPGMDAAQKNKTDKKNKTALIRENKELNAKIDSLTAEIFKLNNFIEKQDSISNGITEGYPASEDFTEEKIEYNAETTDSLLNIWYLHKSLKNTKEETFDMDSVHFSSNVPDSVYIARIKAMNSFITLPYNDIVKNYIILYSEKMNSRIGQILGLASYYMPLFEEIFSSHDLPEELKAMAVIESALNPTAVSRVGAKGMWQFMYGTAKIYGLNINSFVDERLDPVKSAHAAAAYLADSYKIFGDWNLAIASYNCGAGNVNKAIRRSGGKRDFWSIYPYLPRETRGYVPAFVGALYTMNYYKEHGIVPDPVSLPSVTDTFKVHKMLHFKQIEDLTGLSVQTLRNLNPQYRHDIVPGNEREYILRIPFKYSNAFIDHEDSLYSHKADIYFNPVTIKKIKDGGDGQRIVYKVRNGDVLGKIAMRYRVSVSAIKRWNNLRSNTIRVGQRLIIYSGAKVAQGQPSGQSAAKSQSSVNPNLPYTTYKVKNGDNLYDIAKRYPGVSAQNIMDFNKMGNKIYPGMTIRIPKVQ